MRLELLVETMAVPPRPIATGTEGNGSLTKEFAGSWSGTDGGENGTDGGHYMTP